ncbi:hypothetical protein AAC387_Pa07g2433 [Persea americana]
MLRTASRTLGWRTAASWRISRSCSVVKGSRILWASSRVSWEVDSKAATPFSSALCFYEGVYGGEKRRKRLLHQLENKDFQIGCSASASERVSLLNHECQCSRA